MEYYACELESDVNMAWFTEPARRAMLTTTTTPGHYHSAKIIEQKDNFTQLNQIDNYADAKDLYVKVTDAKGNPLEGIDVRFGIYNYAEFYPVAKLPTNRQGITSLRLGLGDIMVWAGNKSMFNFQLVSVAKTDTVVIELKSNTPEKAHFDFDIIPPPIKKPYPSNAIDRRKNTRRLAIEDSIRKSYEDTFMGRKEAVDFALQYSLNTAKFSAIIKKSRGNYREICKFVAGTGETNRKYIIPFLEVISEKDLRDAPSSVLISHINNTKAYNENYIPEDMWIKICLKPAYIL